ncbi:hypothetical protein [Nocardia wallacei]|uniref:hypothetical protein n=1 Tax=Nocardia wallacei TaxID=480035 RepID=UPI0024552037|nr:hypothetical protein [Nocardia wallacei]
MTDEAINLELAARMPWLYAESESIWAITGTHHNGRDTFTNCLAMVMPFYATDGHRLFVLIQPQLNDQRPIPPDRITHARRLILVHADEPRTAYFADEQDLVDRP